MLFQGTIVFSRDAGYDGNRNDNSVCTRSPDRFFPKKGAFAMIPCKSTCLMYQEGCHKTCPVWRQQQKKRSEEYRRKLTYLKEYNEICSTVVSQLKRMSCHRTYF